jgi:hypothetical protein
MVVHISVEYTGDQDSRKEGLMAGKYDSVIKERHIPRLPMELTEGGSNRQYEIDKYKEQIEDRSPAGLATIYADVRREADELAEKEKAIGIKLEAVAQLLIDVYEGEGISSLNVLGVGSVRTQPSLHSQVKDKELFRTWCIENGLQAQMSLPWSTANSIVKERLLNGEETPGVDVYFKTTPVLTRAK